MMDIPHDVQKVISTIEASGYEAWAVGGCVRDSLLGKKPKDFDVASPCPPEEVCKLFPKCIKTGIKYGTVTVITDTVPVEVTVFRSESDYSDSRHPNRVVPVGDVETDLSRRDFTINAMAWHPTRGLCDPFGGRHDLENKIVRAVGDPNIRFDEDALRVLRCLRFASTLDFDVESSTLDAAAKNSPALSKISAERIRDEILKLLLGSRPELIAVVVEAGGLSHIGIIKITDPLQLRNLPPVPPVRLAAFLWCCLDEKTTENIKNILSKLCMDKRTILNVSSLISEMLNPLPKDIAELKKRFSCLPPQDWENLLALRSVLLKEETAFLRKLINQAASEPWNRSMLAVSGHDLKSLGIKGRDTGKVLEILLDMVINNPALNDYDALMSIAENLKADFPVLV